RTGGWHEDSGPQLYIRSRNAIKQRAYFPWRMPVRTAIPTDPAVTPLLQVKEAMAIQQADRDAFAGDADNLAQGLPLRIGKAERSDGDRAIEAAVAKWQSLGPARDVLFVGACSFEREAKPAQVGINPHDARTCAGGQQPCEVTCSASDVKQCFARTKLKRVREQPEL